MSESNDYYQEQAEDCRRMAARARSAEARAFWLRKSGEWRFLMDGTRQHVAEGFETTNETAPHMRARPSVLSRNR
jgi:hypothetical protein